MQFATDADLDADRCVGRVEHVISGRGGRFQSRDELQQFMAAVLRARARDAETPADETSEARDEGDRR